MSAGDGETSAAAPATRGTEMRGKVVLVTGGTGGVGLRSAELLAVEGATVVVNGRTDAGGEAALARLASIAPNRAFFEKGDCADHASAARVVANVVERCGGLDVLVSAGAEGKLGPRLFSEMSAQDIEDVYRTRFFPRIFPAHAALPALRTRGGGAVVMLTTDAARHPTPGESIVGGVGAAVMVATKTLAKEFAKWRIRVNSVAMTITSDTPSWDRSFSEETYQKKLFEKAVARFPGGRAPTAQEVAEVVAFLASGRAAQVTGQTISVNGGLSFGGW